MKSITGNSVDINGKSLPVGKLYRDQFMKMGEGQYRQIITFPNH